MANQLHDFIVVREIIAAQRHLRDDHYAVPYIQSDESSLMTKAFQAIISALNGPILLPGHTAQHMLITFPFPV
ncbi:hypothetical protein OI69_13540 [Pectobacterium fontis]|uniref:Uncharacterized protein n=1 Tax=Pectobacterium fontis TaxID=2558042 RepID=A0A7V8IHF1_9GAMM|nr:hypothetical protein OI69_13540 [Pectobacterium fontis]